MFVLVEMVSKTVTRPITVNSATCCHTLSQGGYSGFQMTGMIEGFFGGLKFSILVNNLASNVLGGLVYMQVGTFLGIQNKLKILGCAGVSRCKHKHSIPNLFFVLYHYFFLENVKDFQARKFSMAFFDVDFLSRDFFWGGG